MHDADDERGAGRSRRRVLAAAGTALAAGLAGCGGSTDETTPQDDEDEDDETDPATETGAPETTTSETPTDSDEAYPPLGNYPVEGDTLTYGFTVPLSGPFDALGEHQRRGYDLAVTHLNEGGGWADEWPALSGSGVRGKRVTAAFADTATDASEARRAVADLVETEAAIMISGGVSTAVAVVSAAYCQRERVQHMAALTTANDVTGSQCRRYSFREMHNVEMGLRGLTATLVDDIGSSGTVSVLYPDYAYGQSVQETATRLLGDRGWTTGETVPVPLDTADYTTALDSIPRDSDVLVLSQFGPRAATALQQATETGFAEETTLVVPLMDRTFLDAAGSELAGVYGTVDWHWTRSDRFSATFTDAYEAEYGERPPAVARLAYAATMRYSAAVERADTFYPPEVVRAMEDREYDDTGLGRARSRGCDHQSIRPVFVVEGTDSAASETPVEIVARQGPETVTYGCAEGPAAACELGTYQ